MNISAVIARLSEIRARNGNLETYVSVWTTNDEDFGTPEFSVENGYLVLRGKL